jgi:hypothetical protein
MLEGLPDWQRGLFDIIDRWNREVQDRLWPDQPKASGDAEYAAIVDKDGNLASIRDLRSSTEDDLRRVA